MAWWADLGLELDRVEEKIGEEKTQLTRQDQVKNPVATRELLFFLLKRHRFDLKKTKLTRQLGQNPKPKLLTGSATKSGLKTMFPCLENQRPTQEHSNQSLGHL